nr:MAG TPA: hypothetical protein [Caudoviricetes sp.]
MKFVNDVNCFSPARVRKYTRFVLPAHPISDYPAGLCNPCAYFYTSHHSQTSQSGMDKGFRGGLGSSHL